MFYPGHISLSTGTWFVFPYGNSKAAVAIDRHVEASCVTNFTVEPQNWPVSSDFGATSGSALTVKYGVGPLPYEKKVIIDPEYSKIISSASYTVLVLAIESAPDGKGYLYDSDFAEILAFFVEKYRVVAGDVNIRTLAQSPGERYFTRRYFYLYSAEEQRLPLDRRLTVHRELSLSLGTFKFHDLVEAVPFHTPEQTEDISHQLQLFFSNSKLMEAVAPKEQALTIAQQIQLNRNYKFALLQAFIYCETAISNFLRRKKLAAGISRKKLDELESEIPFSYMLSVELPTFVPCDKHDKQLLGEIDRLRKLRNNVVHRGCEVSEKDAEKALDALQKLHQFLSRGVETGDKGLGDNG